MSVLRQKLSALMKIRKFLDFNKTRVLFKGFFESQFKYCLLTWMLYSRNTNNKINQLYERALRLVYDDYELTFEKRLEKDGLFTVHHYNIQALCIELYKVYHNIAQIIFSDYLYATITLIIYMRDQILLSHKLAQS